MTRDFPGILGGFAGPGTSEMLLNNLNLDMFKPFCSHRGLLSWFWSRARRLAQVLKGIPSERRIYESTLVGQTKLFSLGRTPSTAGAFRKKFRKNSGKTPETLSEHFLEFPSRVRLGSPKPYNSRHLRLPEHFQNSFPPPVRLGTPLFSEVVPERASQSQPWNSQQYWGYTRLIPCLKNLNVSGVFFDHKKPRWKNTHTHTHT